MTTPVIDGSMVKNPEDQVLQETHARLIYFSSVSEYTHRFVSKLSLDTDETARLPLKTREPTLIAQQPFVLMLPTYGGGNGQGAVPKQVIKFLNVARNRDLIRGVIASGNTNFYEAYCLAGDIVSTKCQVPVLYKFELMGTAGDVDRVREGLEQFWQQHSLNRN